MRTGPRAQIQQRFRWVNQISYRDSQQRDHTLSVLECRETQPTPAGSRETTKFLWVTDLTLTKNNVREVADNAGRIRWKIENEGFNVQKNGGFELEPAYSQNVTAAKVFYFLLQIAHLLFQLIARGSLLRQFFLLRGTLPGGSRVWFFCSALQFIPPSPTVSRTGEHYSR